MRIAEKVVQLKVGNDNDPSNAKHRNRSLPPTTSTHSPLLCCSSLSLTAQTYNLVNAPLLCSASLSLSQPNSPDSTQSGLKVPQKGQSTTAGCND
ncbi:hypothetical protein J1N35_025910 [Gossypium stocksii]|uniref:Uncharacterized protein n=1 Tax=Gossypium stocksii TaxID=47602 RepID=A0A9D3V7H6_9ROSI|nr:hypothetical protein J1N35_025910 [Gossypium stocksii]